MKGVEAEIGRADSAAGARIDQRSLGGRPAFTLGRATVDPATRLVIGPLGQTSIEPRVMQVLLVLAEAKGRVVPRDELVARCWAGVPVGDDSINRTVAEVRRLERVSGAGFVVHTVPRTGYRLDVADGAAEAGVGNRRLVLGGALGIAGLAAAGLALRTNAGRAGEIEGLMHKARDADRLAMPDASRQGIAELENAAAMAPGDADVWGALALALRSGAEFADPRRTAGLLSAAEDAARRGLAIDPERPDARMALAFLVPIHGNWAVLDARFSEILADWPQHLPALDGLSQVRAAGGLLAAHYPLRLQTVALDPLHAAYNFRSIYAHWMNGRLAAADRAAARGIELWPRHFATWTAQLDLFLCTGRPERALAMLDMPSGLLRPPPVLFSTARAVGAALLSGTQADRENAIKVLDGSIARAGPLLAVHGAMCLAALGEVERSMAVILAFLLARGPVMAGTAWQPGQPLHNDVRRRFTNFMFTPVMADVQALPQFERLCAEIGLADYWRTVRLRPEFLGVRPLPV